MKIACSTLVILFCLAAATAAQNPLIRNYKSDETKTDARIWTIQEDGNGMLLAGTDDGLLTYDGTTWSRTPAPGRFVRRLFLASDGKVYFGTGNDFGYLEKNERGQNRFVSLKHLLPSSLTMRSVFGILEAHASIYFETQFFVVRYSLESGQASVIYSPVFLQNVTLLGDRLLASSETGFIYIHPDNSISRFSILNPQDAGIYLGFQTGDGRVLAQNQNDELVVVDDLKSSANRLWNAEISREINGKLYLGHYRTHRLKDVFGGETFIFHSLSDGVYVTDSTGNILVHVGPEDGLLTGQILDSYVDRDQNLWLATPKGLGKVMLGVPARRFNETENLPTPVRSLGKLGNSPLIGTELGLHIKTGNTFQLVKNTPVSQIWEMKPWNDGLLVAGGNRGTWFLQPSSVRIRTIAVATMSVLPLTPEFALSGLYNGLTISRLRSDSLVKEFTFEEISSDCRSLAFGPDSTIWVGTRYDGIFSFSLPEWLRDRSKTPAITWYGPPDGLEKIEFNNVELYNGKILATDSKEVYAFDAASKKFLPLTSPDFTPESFPDLKVDEKGKLWLVSEGLSFSGNKLDSLSLRFLKGSIFDIQEEGDSILVAASSGLYVLHKSAGARTESLPVSIRYIAGGKRLAATSVDRSYTEDEALHFNWDERDVSFYFSSPYYVMEELTVYQYRLIGLDNDWQRAPAKNHVRYPALPAGNYVFELKASHGFGTASAVLRVPISVGAPWYAAWYSLLFYVLLLSLLAFLVFRAYNLRLLSRNQFLEGVIEERTSEISKQNNSLERQAAELRQANELKSRFINMAIHDMRNPLGAVSGYVDLLKEHLKDQPENLAITDRIDRVVRQMLARVADLLDTHRTGNGVHPFAVKPLLEELLISNTVLATRKNQILDAELETDAQVFARPGDIRDACDNLINNAIKFSPKGSRILVQLQLFTTGSDESRWLRLAVHDEGPGIPLTDHEHIFKPYTTLTAKPTGGEISTGLGLSIVKDIVESYQGRIWFNSNPTLRKGSSFYIDLPVSGD